MTTIRLIPGNVQRLGNSVKADDAAPFTTLDGTATDPETVTLTIVRPDGTALIYAWPVDGPTGPLIRESAGRFYADVYLDQPGTWRYELLGTGAVTAAAEGKLRVFRSRVLP